MTDPIEKEISDYQNKKFNALSVKLTINREVVRVLRIDKDKFEKIVREEI